MKITLQNISKTFGTTLAVDDFSCELPDGHLICLLGPSGCGKSTLLNMICGILTPSKGNIFFDEDDVTNLPPDKRNIGMVFQNYALYPHLNVLENIAFPLEIKKVPKKERFQKATEIAKLVRVDNLLKRFPSELSGGQQQRVAIARALIKNPKILLMDEPLSNLDARLRLEMREEIRRIQKQTGITTVFVTHDQEEALGLSDKIAVINNGQIIQYDTPEKIYFEPKDKFVADFVGRANILKDTETNKEYMIRPEWFTISKVKKEFSFTGKIVSVEFLGSYTRYKVKLNNLNQIVTCDNMTFDEKFSEMDTVFLIPNKKYYF